jgi:hypothetical protein
MQAAKRKGASAEFRDDWLVLDDLGEEPQAAASRAREMIARSRIPAL